MITVTEQKPLEEIMQSLEKCQKVYLKKLKREK